MIARLYSLNKQFINLNGKLLALPKLIEAFIMDTFGYGWDRNRAIDTLGTHNNALMGWYLLAVSNTTITISGLLITDTLLALTTNGLVGTIATNNIISFTAGNKYGAFEVYRGTSRIGRYCLTERQGLQIINQVTGGLPNGLLGGTTTTVWQRSNAFYCETNHTGYSISGTGWVTSEGVSLTVGTIIPADSFNPIKCMAWVSGVQQDLQFVGKAKNSVSVVPQVYHLNFNYRFLITTPSVTITSHRMSCYIKHVNTSGAYAAGLVGQGAYAETDTRAGGIDLFSGWLSLRYYGLRLTTGIFLDAPVYIESEYIGASNYARLSVTNLVTSEKREVITMSAASSYQRASGVTGVRTEQNTYFSTSYEEINGVVKFIFIPDLYTDNVIDIANGVSYPLTLIITNKLANVDCGTNPYNTYGYELWVNNNNLTDVRIYPLKYNGTRIITPAGYSLVETVTAGNMPSIADSRMSTFKYALANSYALRQSVPEAFDTTDPCAPKLLTYSELSALSANPKVIKTEADGKITNIKIK